MSTLLAVRFWPKVQRGSRSECWPWQAATLDDRGYGVFGLSLADVELLGLEARKARTVLAHRLAFRLVWGHWPEPRGLHGCDNPPCCNAENPEHVHEGTPRLNTQEMYARGRHLWRGKEPFSAEEKDEIRRRYAQGGVSQREMAVEFDCSRQAISLITRGEL